jgi:predicted TPR repeat methyltransferase
MQTVTRKLNPLESVAARARKTMFDVLYKHMSGTYESIVKALGYAAPEVVVDALVPLMPEGPCLVLDAGCGTGLTGRTLHEHRPDTTLHGFDLMAEMIVRAKKTGLYGRLIQADATKPLPIEGRPYDVAMSSGLYTLGHVGPEALLPVINVIKPGGIFVFNVFEPAWQRLNFGPAIEKMAKDGLIEKLSETHAGHWRRMKDETSRIIVLKVKQ